MKLINILNKLYKIKYNKYINFLNKIPKIIQKKENIYTIYKPKLFKFTLLKYILKATKRIYIILLYLENDESGKLILSTLYKAKIKNINLDICIIVDLNRANRKNKNKISNSLWYYKISKKYNVTFPIYGIPIHIKEIFGVLHLKGIIIDNYIIYTNSSISNTYMHQHKNYRIDRYQIINNSELSTIMIDYIKRILSYKFKENLNKLTNKKFKLFSKINKFRNLLKKIEYKIPINNFNYNNNLTITPIVGIGKFNKLNRIINYLIYCTKYKLILCTPYFNFPKILIKNISKLLKNGKNIEIIVSDKVANDFYIKKNKSFKIINILPYLYEINLKYFLLKFKSYIKNKQLIVRIWKNKYNTFHLKGIWVDNDWQLLTSSNLNKRSWKLDLENGLLIHDPKNILIKKNIKDLHYIRKNTHIISDPNDLEDLNKYPLKIRKILFLITKIKIDKLIKNII